MAKTKSTLIEPLDNPMGSVNYLNQTLGLDIQFTYKSTSIETVSSHGVKSETVGFICKASYKDGKKSLKSHSSAKFPSKKEAKNDVCKKIVSIPQFYEELLKKSKNARQQVDPVSNKQTTASTASGTPAITVAAEGGHQKQQNNKGKNVLDDNNIDLNLSLQHPDIKNNKKQIPTHQQGAVNDKHEKIAITTTNGDNKNKDPPDGGDVNKPTITTATPVPTTYNQDNQPPSQDLETTTTTTTTTTTESIMSSIPVLLKNFRQLVENGHHPTSLLNHYSNLIKRQNDFIFDTNVCEKPSSSEIAEALAIGNGYYSNSINSPLNNTSELNNQQQQPPLPSSSIAAPMSIPKYTTSTTIPQNNSGNTNTTINPVFPQQQQQSLSVLQNLLLPPILSQEKPGITIIDPSTYKGFVFKSTVYFSGTPIATGFGTSKKAAKSSVAYKTLDKLALASEIATTTAAAASLPSSSSVPPPTASTNTSSNSTLLQQQEQTPSTSALSHHQSK
ncbi:hypothetical protein H4219_005147 [Mycoemilia scoparia]|uniref:DRBM domain-containing protein n=1 Tax=Mycoemilia scoparia TaxID=417184 RepID=A0A9W8DPW1_9FUNG|nr:hypothetical protein H4219_005147 [Mycoemilia scoparia]